MPGQRPLGSLRKPPRVEIQDRGGCIMEYGRSVLLDVGGQPVDMLLNGSAGQLSGFEQGMSQMAHDRLLKVSTRMLLFAVVVSASHGLSSCSGPRQLPDGARDALVAYWESLPSHPGVENRIVRAWPGEAPAQLTSGTPLMETWCVEAEISSADDPSVDGDLLVWIVTRENDETPWSAALLATMSSIWPYQACGEAP